MPTTPTTAIRCAVARAASSTGERASNSACTAATRTPRPPPRDAHGYTVLAGAADKPHGLREAYVVDADGYVWVPDIPTKAR